MTRARIRFLGLIAIVMVAGTGSGRMQAPPPASAPASAPASTPASTPAGAADPLRGWKSKADLDALVAGLRNGTIKGPQAIFERTSGQPYRVYTSFVERRKAAADVHQTDDEIFIVLSGAAKSTLGGEIADPKTTGPGEIRGTIIRGGETRAVAVGDIISAPRGTPHQMDATDGHVLYVVIKIRGTGAS